MLADGYNVVGNMNNPDWEDYAVDGIDNTVDVVRMFKDVLSTKANDVFG